jgi:tetratricopeptide (TPR) repeat protein
MYVNVLPSGATIYRMRALRSSPDRRILLLVALLVCVSMPVPAGAAEPQKRTLELRGKVALPPHTLPPKRRLLLTLNSMSSPFSSRTWGGFDGSFRFRNLEPGTYSLSIYIPDDGEILQTVDVTPSFADAKGRIVKTFSFDEPTLRTIVRPVPQSLVSARLLAIPFKAKNEYQKAENALEDRDAERAIQHLKTAIEIAPTFAEALNTLGTIYFQQREFSEAERCFRAALKEDRGAYEPLVNLGGTLLAQRRWQEALEMNLQAASLQPNDPLVNAQLGLAYVATREYDQAIYYLQATERLDPGHFSNPQISLAEIFLRQEDREGALEELQDFLRIHPDSPDAAQVRGTIERITKAEAERRNSGEVDSSGL